MKRTRSEATERACLALEEDKTRRRMYHEVPGRF
ncbi:hypothetical protein F443_22876 [Phytophthora nicotianae P1569]|uniref:Uncharacterized protein n=1 Tax=Phytophthora nicotianae P1569 TaxID=1317065 RepID=V9DSY5_PHYNI|nr:hypothetical protein F443_22876 [Phytophthora nicotianae P1569]